jgi:hypothetical protein
VMVNANSPVCSPLKPLTNSSTKSNGKRIDSSRINRQGSQVNH